MMEKLRFAQACIEDLHGRMVEVAEILEREQDRVGRQFGLNTLAGRLRKALDRIDQMHALLTDVAVAVTSGLGRLSSAQDVSSVEDALALLGANGVDLSDALRKLESLYADDIPLLEVTAAVVVFPQSATAQEVSAVTQGARLTVDQARRALWEAIRANDDGAAGLSGGA